MTSSIYTRRPPSLSLLLPPSLALSPVSPTPTLTLIAYIAPRNKDAET